jgi:hypothetical protein
MKFSKLIIAFIAIFSFAIFAAPAANAQFGGVLNKTKNKVKDKTKVAEGKTKSAPKTETKNTGGKTENESNADLDDSDTRSENAKNLAKAAGMPKAANTDAALNKLLFQSADDHRLIPRRVIVTDKNYLMMTNERSTKIRRIFAVVARTLDDGSGKCGKQMTQFDQDWRDGKWGAVYVQNIGAITPIACSAIGK